MKYEVTIGIPVYNAEKYIRQSLDSALVQKYTAIEFLIVDDCSTDSSMSVIQGYQQKHPRGKDIHVFSQTVSKGPGAARNKIIDEAQGRFLYFMDADDLMEPNTIALLMEHQRRTGADIVYGSYDKVETYNQGRVLETCQYPFLELEGDDSLATYAYRRNGSLQTTIWNYIVNTEVLRKACLRFVETNYWEDMAFTFDLVTLCHKAVLLPDITYHYMCHYDSLSNYQHRERISKDEILRNISVVDYMKRQCAKSKGKSYQPQRCLSALKTDFFILCYILKNVQKITPSFTHKELKDMMSYPAALFEIVRFRKGRTKNFLFYLFGKLPAGVMVWVGSLIGRRKGLV